MKRFVIATHAELAEGFYKACKFFKDDLDNVSFINAYVKSNDFEKEILEVLTEHKHEDVIIFTDLIGGSVNQICTRLLLDHKFKLVSGINLALVLELIMQGDDLLDESIDLAIENAKEQMKYINKMFLEDEL